MANVIWQLQRLDLFPLGCHDPRNHVSLPSKTGPRGTLAPWPSGGAGRAGDLPFSRGALRSSGFGPSDEWPRPTGPRRAARIPCAGPRHMPRSSHGPACRRQPRPLERVDADPRPLGVLRRRGLEVRGAGRAVSCWSPRSATSPARTCSTCSATSGWTPSPGPGGARVTGADISERAIEQAASAGETGLDGRFVVSDVVDLPDNLEGDFGVFTSFGALIWLPDLPGGPGGRPLRAPRRLLLHRRGPPVRLDLRRRRHGHRSTHYHYWPSPDPLVFPNEGSAAAGAWRSRSSTRLAAQHGRDHHLAGGGRAAHRGSTSTSTPWVPWKMFPFAESRPSPPPASGGCRSPTTRGCRCQPRSRPPGTSLGAGASRWSPSETTTTGPRPSGPSWPPRPCCAGGQHLRVVAGLEARSRD